MGFLDDLGKKMSDVGQATVQKTREFSEINRISELIEQNEAKINSLYYKIGKQYVKLHEEDSEDALKELVGAVTNLQKEITSYENQIKEIGEPKRCEKCGAVILKGYAFCINCGEPVSKKGGPKDAGKKDAAAESAPAEAEKPETEKADTVKKEAVKICPSCKAELPEGAAFCIKCGAKQE